MLKASEIFRNNLSKAIEDLGLTQQALADKSGVNRSQIASYLSGRTTPTIDNLAAIATALQVSCHSLLGLEPPTPQPPTRDPTDAEIAAFILGKLKIKV